MAQTPQHDDLRPVTDDVTTTAGPRPDEGAAAARRSVSLERLDTGVYLARNSRGGELTFGSRAGEAFTPVELLLAAIAGCSAVDVDVVTGRRSAADVFEVLAEADAVRDAGGNVLENIEVTFRLEFPAGEAGDAARAILPRAVSTSHDRTCTVSRTVEAGTPVTVRVAGVPGA